MRVLKFTAQWCSVCKLLNTNLGDVIVEEIDVDDRPDLAKKYKIKALPTLVFTKDGKEVSRLTGAQKQETLRAVLAKAALTAEDIALAPLHHVAANPEHQLQPVSF